MLTPLFPGPRDVAAVLDSTLVTPEDTAENTTIVDLPTRVPGLDKILYINGNKGSFLVKCV